MPQFEPVLTDFQNQAKGIKFKKEVLIEELLSIGHAKITKQIAELIGDEIEKEIQRRKIQFLSSELISEMVEGKLEELGLIRPRAKSEQPKNSPTELAPEVLEVLQQNPNENVILPSTSNIAPLANQTFAVALSDKALEILKQSILAKDEKGEVVETPEQMFNRVARAIASPDTKYSPSENLARRETEFFNLMVSLEFLPSPQILANAGRALGLLSSCFILPIHDTMESIFETLKQAAVIQKSGGNTGFSFNRLRPHHDEIHSTHGFSSGPIPFMKVYDAATEAVRLGGIGGGYNRSYLSISHPDIFDFLDVENSSHQMNTFIKSVGITKNFMKTVEEDTLFALTNPRTGETVRQVKAVKLFRELIRHIQKMGEPHLFFVDTIEKGNPTPLSGNLEEFDPCGGQPLLPYESCTHGAINLAVCVEGDKIRWDKLKRIVHSSVHFLDNVIESNHYPLPEIETAAKRNRKIGLGIMGWADFLIQLKISYTSYEAETLASQLMNFIQNEAVAISCELGKKRGVFPNYYESVFADSVVKRRHAVVTALFPTPLTSQIAGVSAGIEPWPATTEEEISPEWKIKMQAAFQRHTENGISDPLFISEAISVEKIEKIILLGYHLGLKGMAFTLCPTA